jgi:F-type H+-transporting ATPase subunit b
LELNWSTFALEIINFLVLVWILKRFFYQPVLQVIARRRAGIEKTMNDARKLRDEAQALRRQYEERLAEWDRERRAAREQLTGEIEAERTQRLQALQGALEQERERAAVVEQRRLDHLHREMERTALAQGGQFAARLLSLAGGPVLQEKLLELLFQQLDRLPEAQREALRGSAARAAGKCLVTSATALEAATRARLEQALATALGVQGPIQYQEDPELVAGVRISLGAWVLQANVKDELAGFARLAQDA